MQRQMLCETKVSFPVLLPASLLAQPMNGIKMRLNDLLLTYQSLLGGIVVSYSKVKLVGNYARIISDCPSVLLTAQAKLLVCPCAIGAQTSGVVTAVSSEYIGLVVMGAFQVSLSAQKIPKTFSFDAAEWLWRDSRHDVIVDSGSILQFTTIAIEDDSGHLVITGSLLDEDAPQSFKRKRSDVHPDIDNDASSTNVDGKEAKNALSATSDLIPLTTISNSAPLEDRKKKKRRKIQFADATTSLASADGISKHKKKDKVCVELGANLTASETPNKEKSKKTSKRKKKTVTKL